MKALAKISFVAAAMFAGSAFAADSLLGELPDYPQVVQASQQSDVPAKTRAQVRAELNASAFDGTELGDMANYPQGYRAVQRAEGPGLTREQVRAELVQANAEAPNAVRGGILYPEVMY